MAWKKIAEGNTAEIYEVEETQVAKLFKQGYPLYVVEQEYKSHLLCANLIDNVPRAYEQIEINGRYGYIMDKVEGISLAELMMNEETAENAMRTFVNLHNKLLETRTDSLISYTEWMKNALSNYDADSEILNKINLLSQGDSLCHGDFHPYNIIITPRDKPMIIDFANLCRAPKEYDIARTYCLLNEVNTNASGVYLNLMGFTSEKLAKYIEIIRYMRGLKL